MTRTNQSLRRRLTAALLLVFTIGLTAAGLMFLHETRQTTSGIANQTLTQQARDLAAGIHIVTGAITIEPPAQWAQAYAHPGASYSYTVFKADGSPIAHSASIAAPLPLVTVPAGQSFSSLELVGPDNRALLGAALPGGYTLVVGRGDPDIEALAETLMEENGEPILVLVLSIGCALVIGWFVAGWSLRPLAQAAREASAIVPGCSSARISPAGLPAEVLPMVEAVNGALDRLAVAYDMERRFTADAAHELRTPLAVLSLRLQQMEMSGVSDWGAVRRDLGNLERLVAQLLDLARKEAASRYVVASELATVDLGRTVREAAAAVLPIVEKAGRSIEVEAPDEAALVRGRADDLRDMVRNLLDNALAHGDGCITAKVFRDGDSAQLEIADEGSGIPVDMRDAVFERFRKGRTASSGSGLGLAIVRQVARSHGGEAFVAGTPGTSRITVRLPAENGPELSSCVFAASRIAQDATPA
jgi:two-component system sensor histidine kinase TctE